MLRPEQAAQRQSLLASSACGSHIALHSAGASRQREEAGGGAARLQSEVADGSGETPQHIPRSMQKCPGACLCSTISVRGLPLVIMGLVRSGAFCNLACTCVLVGACKPCVAWVSLSGCFAFRPLSKYMPGYAQVVQNSRTWMLASA